jgi:hypothetical protein
VFKLYGASSGGTALWTETDSLSIHAGVFQVNLGANTSLSGIDFNANPSLYLGITFNSDPAGEMSPRVQLQSVPYAFNADKVGGLTASQLVQLSPGSGQTGFINISGGNTSINSGGSGTTAIGNISAIGIRDFALKTYRAGIAGMGRRQAPASRNRGDQKYQNSDFPETLGH